MLRLMDWPSQRFLASLTLPATARWSCPAGASRKFTHVLLDPPRTGAADVLPAVARLAPRRVVYVSCHPGSLARDLGILVTDHGFSLRAAGIVDMFPHTSHVESVAVLDGPGVSRE
jgi:23S rRNA (uracil1939-C5)-methyltransferase